MSELQLHAITLENVIKLQFITITSLSTPTLRGVVDKPVVVFTPSRMRH